MPTRLLKRSNHPVENMNSAHGCNSSISCLDHVRDHQCFSFKPFRRFSWYSRYSRSSTSGQNARFPLPIRLAPLLAFWIFSSLEICKLFLLMPNWTRSILVLLGCLVVVRQDFQLLSLEDWCLGRLFAFLAAELDRTTSALVDGSAAAVTASAISTHSLA